MSFAGELSRYISFKLSVNKQEMKSMLDKFGSKSLNLNQSNLINKTYESNVDVYSVVKKVVDIFVSVDWIVEEKQSGGVWVEIENTSIHELMEEPNSIKGYTWADIDEQLCTYLIVSGNSYMVGEDLFGKIAEINVLPSNHVEIETKDDFFLPDVKYKFDLGTTRETYDTKELEHIKMFNPSYNTIEDSFLGLSAFQVAANVVQVGNDKWEADAHLLQNRGAFGLISDQSDRPMTKEEAETVQGAFDKDTAGPENYGKVKVTNKKLTYIPMGMSSTDLQLVEKGVITLRAMCNVLGLDSSLFNDPANKTFNNRLEAEKAMYTNVIIPLADKIAAKHTKYIANNHFPNKMVRMRKDFSKIEVLQSDKQKEAKKDKTVLEGVNMVVNMPISEQAKNDLLTDTYDFSEDTINSVTKTVIPPTENV